jgi:hypothetical protein
MNNLTNDLSLKLVYVAILAGLVLAFTSPLPLPSRQNSSQPVRVATTP